jgi:hypothetical protein
MQETQEVWRIWGGARGFLFAAAKLGRCVNVLGLVGLLFALVDLAGQWTGKHRSVEIELSPGPCRIYAVFAGEG